MAIFSKKTTTIDFSDRNWLGIAPSDDKLSTYNFSQVYREHSDLLLKANDLLGQKIFIALADILMLHLTPEDTAIPYKPIAIFGNKRSLSLDDIDQSDFELLETIANKHNSPAVRARLTDITWVGGRNIGRKTWQLGLDAAKAFLEVSRIACTTDNITTHFDELLRGMQLAREFRKQDETILEEYWKLLESQIHNAINKNDLQNLVRILQIFFERNCNKANELVEIIEAKAIKEQSKGSSPALADLWGVLSDILYKLKDDARAQQALINRGEALIAMGYLISGSAMGASHWLHQGLECLRKAKANPSRIEVVHKQLLDIGKKQLSEMSEFGTNFDASTEINMVREHVTTPLFKDAILRFVFVSKLINPEELRETIEKQAKNSPLQYIIDSKIISRDGRTVGIRPSLMAEGERYEHAINLAMIEQAHRIDIPIRVQVAILPARDQIWNDHHPSFNDISYIVKDNPFIPQSYEESYLRGFSAGFIGDWIVVGHMLIPLVEASIRHVLKNSGAITSNVLPDGIQEEKSLHQLLDTPEAEKIFGTSILFEIKSLTIENLGGNLRNDYAHGLLTDDDYYGADVITLWWLLLRICLMPIAQAEQEVRNS